MHVDTQRHGKGGARKADLARALNHQAADDVVWHKRSDHRRLVLAIATIRVLGAANLHRRDQLKRRQVVDVSELDNGEPLELDASTQSEDAPHRARVRHIRVGRVVREHNDRLRLRGGNLAQVGQADRIADAANNLRAMPLFLWNLLGGRLIHPCLLVRVAEDDDDAAALRLVGLGNFLSERHELVGPPQHERVSGFDDTVPPLLEVVKSRLDGFTDEPDEQGEEEHARQHEQDADEARSSALVVVAAVCHEAPCKPHVARQRLLATAVTRFEKRAQQV